MRRSATARWALGVVAAAVAATAAAAQDPARPAPSVVYGTGAAREAPEVRVWVVDGSTRAGAATRGRSYDPYDPADFDDGRGTARVYFRVDDDAYVTVAAIGTGGRVRILHPRDAGDLRLSSARVTQSAWLDGGATDGGDWSDWGYVAAIASYGAPDYADYTRRGEWRTRTVARPELDDPTAAVEELARQLYPDGGQYTVDFAFYRTPRRDYAQRSGDWRYRSCATFGHGWTFAPWELLSPYDVGCWHPAWGYYGWAPLLPAYPSYPWYPPPGYGPPRGRSPDVGDEDGRWAARDASHGRRPTKPRGSSKGANLAGDADDRVAGADGDRLRPPHTVDRARLRASPPDQRVYRTDDPPRVVRSPVDPRSTAPTRDGWRVGAPVPDDIRSMPTRGAEPSRSQPTRSAPARTEPPPRKAVAPSAGEPRANRAPRSDAVRFERPSRSEPAASRPAPSSSGTRSRPTQPSGELRGSSKTRPQR